MAYDYEQGIQLLGRVFLEGRITALTGLYIGGNNTGLAIGGADATVVRNPLTNEPYIPGSSLKGKLRSLLEKVIGDPNRQRVLISGRDRMAEIRILTCDSIEEYETCAVSNIFGPAGQRAHSYPHLPTRLMVRDAAMTRETVRRLEHNPNTDMPLTEVKTEVVLDRLTSAATPRQRERVPAGAQFGFQLVYNIYLAEEDPAWFEDVILGMGLMEGDCLGGQGSRGYGQVTFNADQDKVTARLELLSDAAVSVQLPSGAAVTNAGTGFVVAEEYQAALAKRFPQVEGGQS